MDCWSDHPGKAESTHLSSLLQPNTIFHVDHLKRTECNLSSSLSVLESHFDHERGFGKPQAKMVSDSLVSAESSLSETTRKHSGRRSGAGRMENFPVPSRQQEQ